MSYGGGYNPYNPDMHGGGPQPVRTNQTDPPQMFSRPGQKQPTQQQQQKGKVGEMKPPGPSSQRPPPPKSLVPGPVHLSSEDMDIEEPAYQQAGTGAWLSKTGSNASASLPSSSRTTPMEGNGPPGRKRLTTLLQNAANSLKPFANFPVGGGNTTSGDGNPIAAMKSAPATPVEQQLPQQQQQQQRFFSVQSPEAYRPNEQRNAQYMVADNDGYMKGYAASASDDRRPVTSESSSFGNMYGVAPGQDRSLQSPPLSAGPIGMNPQQQDAKFNFATRSVDLETGYPGRAGPGQNQPQQQNYPRDPRSQSSQSLRGSTVADAFPSADSVANRPYQVNPYQATASSSRPVNDDYDLYRSQREAASHVEPAVKPRPMEPPCSGATNDSAIMSVLKKIGLDEDVVRTIKNLTDSKSQQPPRAAAHAPPPATTPAPVVAPVQPPVVKPPVVSVAPQAVATPQQNPLSFLGVDLNSVLSSRPAPQQNQVVDATYMATTVAQIISGFPPSVQQKLADSPQMLEVFKTIIYENVKSSMAQQQPVQQEPVQQQPQLSESDLSNLAVDRFLKRERLTTLKGEEDKLMLQQREMIKQMTKSKMLLESNPLLMANMDLLQNVQTAVQELQAEVRLLERYLGPRASVPVPEELIKQSKEARKQNKSKPDGTACKYVDSGDHWCKCCNEVFDTLPAFYTHLYSNRHIEIFGHEHFPQLNKDVEREQQAHASSSSSSQPEDLPEKPVLGVQFVVPVTQTYYCVLCRTFANGDDNMTLHIKSQSHQAKVLDYVEDKGGFYDKCWELDKAFSYFAKTKIMLPSFLASRGLPVPPPSKPAAEKQSSSSSFQPSSSRRSRSRSRSRSRGRNRSRSRTRSRSRGRSRRSRTRSRSRQRTRRSRSRSNTRRRTPSRSPDRSKRSNRSNAEQKASKPSSGGLHIHLRTTSENGPSKPLTTKPADVFGAASTPDEGTVKTEVAGQSSSQDSLSSTTRVRPPPPPLGMATNATVPTVGTADGAYEVIDELNR